MKCITPSPPRRQGVVNSSPAMKSFHVAIAGATGAVGVEMLKTLESRNFPVASLKLLASSRSAGKTVTFKGKEYTVEELTEHSFDKPIDIALFSAGGSSSLCIYLALGIEMSVYRYSKAQSKSLFYT